MKLLINMNLPRELGKHLQGLGHTCRHAGDIGLSSASDQEIILIARENGEVILTHDLDYGALLVFSGESNPSVVIFRKRDMRIESITRHLSGSLSQISEALEKGAIVILEDHAIRIRLLPIRQAGE